MPGEEITINIHCQNFPGKEFEGKAAVRLGVQKGNDVIDDVSGDEDRVTFRIPLGVEKNLKTNKPNFLGPFAHGSADERFIYLSWGERKGSEWEMFRRAKIHLSHLDWTTIEKALAANRPLEAFLNMIDEKGGPLCASVKGSNIRWNETVS